MNEPKTAHTSFTTRALVYLALVSFGLAQPLFNTVLVFRREFQVSLFDVITLVVVFQFALTAALLFVRTLAGSKRGWVDVLVYMGATLSIIRQIQQTGLETEGLDSTTKLAIAGAFLALALAVAIALRLPKMRQHMDGLLSYAGMLAPLFGAFFLYEMVSSPIPLRDGAPRVAEASSQPPLMIVVFDELSRDVLLDANGDVDAERFPNFARLSRLGVWFPNAMANYPTSQFSFPSFLSGRYDLPGDRNLADNLEELPADSLTSRLIDEGYTVHAYSNYFGCWNQTFHCDSYLAGDDASFLVRAFAKFAQEFGPDFLVDWLLPWLGAGSVQDELDVLTHAPRAIDAGEFHLIHLMGTHAPYLLNAHGDFLFTRHTRMVQGAAFDAAYQAHLAQVAYVDRQIGPFLDALEQTDYLERGYLLAISDHGNCWSDDCPGRVYPHHISVVRKSLPAIPAFLAGPGLERRVDPRDFQLVDIPPTVLGALGLNTPAAYDGRDALGGDTSPRPRPFYLHPERPPLDLDLPIRDAVVK